MPYDGGSVIGLIILLFEVAVPHANNAAYALFCSSIFSLLKLNTNLVFW